MTLTAHARTHFCRLRQHVSLLEGARLFYVSMGPLAAPMRYQQAVAHGPGRGGGMAPDVLTIRPSGAVPEVPLTGRAPLAPAPVLHVLVKGLRAPRPTAASRGAASRGGGSWRASIAALPV